jgi:hypothetical protein
MDDRTMSPEAEAREATPAGDTPAPEDAARPDETADFAKAEGTTGSADVAGRGDPQDPEAAGAGTTATDAGLADRDAEDAGPADTGHDDVAPDVDAATGPEAAEPGDDSDATGAGREPADRDADTTPTPTEDAVLVEPATSDAPPDLERPPEPAANRTVVERRGPGFVPLVLGGVVAAAIGFFAANSDVIPGLSQDDGTAELQAALSRQADTLAALDARIADLAAAGAPAVDLAPVTDRIDALGGRIDEVAGGVQALSERVTTLEDRPVFTGDVAADAAEAAEAVAALEAQMRAQEEEAARLAAEAEAARAEAAEAVAAAEAEARAAAASAEAEAALERLRLAVAEGAPFADPLGAIADVAEIPESLAAASDTGIPTLEALQDEFPAAAREALPVALRETAGEGAMDRVGAFLQGQLGGRSIEPREGDDPDAVLSRAQAAVTGGDLGAALSEIAALPDAAQAEMSDWIEAARARLEVTEALDAVSQALAGAN